MKFNSKNWIKFVNVIDESSNSSQEKGNWLADMNWRANALLLFLASVFGFSSGSIAPKSTAQGMTQDAADVRYITKDESNRRDEAQERKLDKIEREMVKNAVFEERTGTMFKLLELMRQEQKDDRAATERMLINR